MSLTPLQNGILKIIREFKLSTRFPKEVYEESQHFPDTIPGEELKNRVDLRKEVIFTIDGENARDFDDAVSIRSIDQGGFCLKVSIADVSFYVRPGTTLDEEAFQRGTSTYFPDRVIPMLPERLSNELCSLVPGEDRVAFTVEIDFDDQGLRLSSRFYRSVIRSAARLTYTEVKRILVDRDPEVRARRREVVPFLDQMAVLADRLQKMRRSRGSLDFDLPEPLIELDLEEGKVETIVKAERNAAHRLIEEFMIAANEAVAEFITEQKASMIYRIHEEPDPERVRDFEKVLHNLGFSMRLKKRAQPKNFAEIIDLVRGVKEERVVNTLLLRTLKRAVYETKNRGHFGLASACYTHFTSPIRRYPDLVVHRILGAIVGAGFSRPGAGTAPLRQIATHCSERERISMKAEWASRDLAGAVFLSDRIGETFEGIVSGVTRFGLFIELAPYFVEGLLSLKELKDDYYIFHEKNHVLIGRKKKGKFGIGTQLQVCLKGVNLDRRWVDLELKKI